jgi:hypothetical protein
MLWFKRKIFEKVIAHDDWRDYDGMPGAVIPKSEHKQGKRPRVEIHSSFPEVSYQVMLDGSVKINRNLPIFRGTPFSVKIRIAK